MAYGLPTAGEANWNTKLDASIGFLKTEQDGRLSDATLATTYATILTATSGDELATINSFLSAATPLGAKRLVGSFSVAGKIILPAGVYLDLTAATITQLSDSATTLEPEAGATIVGGKLVGKGTDYVSGSSAPTALGIKVIAADVTVSGTRLEQHAGAGVYAAAAALALDGVRIQGVGSIVTIPASDAACFGVYLSAGCADHSFSDMHIWDASIGIIGSVDTTHLSLSNIKVRDIPGQHGIYLQNGTGLNATGISVSDINLNGVKVQLGSTSTTDSYSTTISGVMGHSCGDSVLSLNNTQSDLATAKRFYGVSISNVSGHNCSRVLYLGSVRGGTVSTISGSSSTTDAFTLIDCQDVTLDGLVSNGSQRLGVRCTTQTGSSSRRVTFNNVRIVDPAGGAVANNVYGWQVNGVTGSDWVDLTIDGVEISSSNANMDYGLFFASGDQETLSLRNVDITGATDNGARLASGPRAVKEWANVRMNLAPLFFPTTALVSGGKGLMNDFFGDAAPTSGTWKHGDRVWSNAPAASGTMGWVCTAAGTPGTWKTFGAIGA